MKLPVQLVTKKFIVFFSAKDWYSKTVILILFINIVARLVSNPLNPRVAKNYQQAVLKSS